jgi:hypothetical protein
VKEAILLARHPNNGPTFSKAPHTKRRRMTDDELAAYQGRKAAEHKEIVRQAAKSRRFHHLMRTDPVGLFLEGRHASEFGGSKDKAEVKPPESSFDPANQAVSGTNQQSQNSP